MDTSVPAPVVIGQDNQTEIHVQPVVQSGRRHLDIRIWRRGPSGFAPSRNALVLRAGDLQALQQGIGELLEASDGGRQAARIVWDDDESRRLRAETEPFGTRYLARFAFWQRVRDTWKAADDGLVLAADRLVPLQHVLEQMRPWMDERPRDESEPEEDALQRHALYGWPSPGADWLTVDLNHLAFHPRGIRITCTVAEEEERRVIVLRQWRRADSLWIPENVTLSLTIVDLDALLFEMARLLENRAGPGATATITCSDGSILRLVVSGGEHEEMLTLEQATSGDGEQYLRRLYLPFQYLPRLGRMLLQAGSFLAARLSEEERNMLQSGEHASPSVVAYDSLPEPIRYEVMRSTLGEDEPAGESPSEEDDIGAQAPDGATLERGADDSRPAPSPSTEGDAPADEGPPIRSTPLKEIELGENLVFLTIQLGRGANLALSWGEGELALPMEELEELVSDLRELYYDALRGRRGRPLTIGQHPAITISVHNQGPRMFCTLEHDTPNAVMRLQFPANQVPVFLDAAQAALARMEREIMA